MAGKIVSTWTISLLWTLLIHLYCDYIHSVSVCVSLILKELNLNSSWQRRHKLWSYAHSEPGIPIKVYYWPHQPTAYINSGLSESHKITLLHILETPLKRNTLLVEFWTSPSQHCFWLLVSSLLGEIWLQIVSNW